MADEGVVRRVVDWLRAGYPSGVPERDYVALLALLRRRLTPDEVADVVERVVVAHPAGAPTRASVEAEMAAVLQHEPLDEDVARVSAVLASVGWPLAPVEP
ncbi:DUF3349 domain-containing protein [Cellulomonas sp. DKR-3]|uniref:DUF3349 domain-containing protein n=1 Tax=Cellulomonas fulva TaxID=2835530 RepID=A0ABS5TZD0_9CELL|nr:DUF3349 domain-containing protein [Cellulomonas fulva]MBT0994515.1 DUF3349 domain-containing protein [Cellulomonas fulva]